MISSGSDGVRVLFVTSASHVPSDKNLNHFQRVYFLSRAMKLTILARRGADFSVSAAPGTSVINSPWPGKAGLMLYAVLLFLRGESRRHDIILTEPSILGALGFIGKLSGGCRWVVDIWDIPIRCYLSTGRLNQIRCGGVRRIFRLLYRWADLFIVSIIPEFELREFALPHAKMLTLRNAIWLEDSRRRPALSNDPETFNLLCMRSIYTHQMGLDTLADAMRLVHERFPEITLTIIGRIPSQVEYQVASLRGATHVRFIEFVEHDELLGLIGKASICVVPFRDVPDLAQTYPIKVIEYMAQGKPVVASDIAGIKRLLRNGDNGVLFRAGDAGDLAEKIVMLYENRHLCSSLAENAWNLDKDMDCRIKNARIVHELSLLSGGIS